MMKLSNNTVFITGGASGIGLSLAKAFIARNNKVIICGRNLDKLEKVKKEVPGIHVVRCDVTNSDDIRKIIEYFALHELNINILINNAGIQYRYDFLSESNADEKIREEIGINFTSVASLT
jgi:uncharacterized oxidoreductase